MAIGWQIYDMERTPLALGLVGLCQFAAHVPVDPAGRRHHRPLQPAAGLQPGGRRAGAVQRPVPGSQHFPPAQCLDVLSWCWCCSAPARGFSGPSGSSLLPFLVPPERLSRSMAFSSSFFTAATISGPALGGFLYALGPVPCLFHLHCRFCRRRADRGASGRPALHAGRNRRPARYERVAEGVRFVRSRPVVLGAISLDLFAVLLGGATALLPVYARDILHVGPAGAGLFAQRAGRGSFLHGLFSHPLADPNARSAPRCSPR